MVLTQSSTEQEGEKQGHQVSIRISLLSGDKPLMSSNNLYFLWAKVSKRCNSEVFPFSCGYKISLAKWNVFKHLCYSRAVNTNRNASTPPDYFTHSSALLSSTGTQINDGVFAATLSAWQRMMMQCKRWIHLKLRNYLERKLLGKGLQIFYLFPLQWLLILSICSWFF